jgi:hypothetical protein
MDGSTLQSTLHSFLSHDQILELSAAFGVVKRERKKDVVALVRSLVLSAGSDDSGRQSDAFTAYLQESRQEVVRGAFYNWFDRPLAMLMGALTQRALERVREQRPFLPRGLAGVRDWILVDSETVTLRDKLADDFPATSTLAGLKVHKYFSLGRGNVIDFRISPAREHDYKHLFVDESWRGCGLIVDLGYVSHRLIRDCQRFGIALVVRLKAGWKLRLKGSVLEDGTFITLDGNCPEEHPLEMLSKDYDGAHFDFDVALGDGDLTVRMTGVPGDKKYHWCLTTLPRQTHTPEQIGKLYRLRWEIEMDNKRDKGGAQLDQIRATSVNSVLTLVHSSLLATMIANELVFHDLRARPKTRAPLHAFALRLAMNQKHDALLLAMILNLPQLWDHLARVFRARGHDPNWRSRPSQLDQLRGTTAPPGRPRRSKQADNSPHSRPYRRPIERA